MRHLFLLVPFALAACATTGAGGGSGMAIDTVSQGQQVTGASCAVSTNAGTWNVVTPANLEGITPNGTLRVVCNKPGYRTSEVIQSPSNPYGSSLGLGVGGGGSDLGVGVGLNFPIRFGGGSYPSRVTVELNPL